MNLLVCLILLCVSNAANWAVLVAGSSTFENYRHQADIFHAYQILIKNGFDKSKIIVMAHDGNTFAKYNPFPGHIFNVPDGPDVYIGTDNIDYKGDNVTAANFFAVLKGDSATAGARVLQSGPDDNVFVFFDGHGSKGVLFFPTGKYGYADELHEAIQTMHTKGMYNKLLFYMESCYSGSMFDGLTDDLNVYVLTAANAVEPSYAQYCNIPKYKVCLSNEWSASWLAFSEYSNVYNTSISEEYEYTVASVNMSHPSAYGRTDISSHMLSEFQAGNSQNTLHTTNSSIEKDINAQSEKEKEKEKSSFVSVSSHPLSQTDATLSFYQSLANTDGIFSPAATQFKQHLLLVDKTAEKMKKLANFFGFKYPDTKYNEKMQQKYSQRRSYVASIQSTPSVPFNYSLYRQSIDEYEKKQGKLNEITAYPLTNILHRAISEGILTDKDNKNKNKSNSGRNYYYYYYKNDGKSASFDEYSDFLDNL